MSKQEPYSGVTKDKKIAIILLVAIVTFIIILSLFLYYVMSDKHSIDKTSDPTVISSNVEEKNDYNNVKKETKEEKTKEQEETEENNSSLENLLNGLEENNTEDENVEDREERQNTEEAQQHEEPEIPVQHQEPVQEPVQETQRPESNISNNENNNTQQTPAPTNNSNEEEESGVSISIVPGTLATIHRNSVTQSTITTNKNNTSSSAVDSKQDNKNNSTNNSSSTNTNPVVNPDQNKDQDTNTKPNQNTNDNNNVDNTPKEDETPVVIVPKLITAVASIALRESNFVYDGTEKQPQAIVTDGKYLLEEGKDYTVSYENNINAGTATAIIEGEGNYTGTVSKEFKIDKANTNAKVTILGENKYEKELSAFVETEDPSREITYQYWTSNSADGREKELLLDEQHENYTIGSGLVGKYVGVTAKVAETDNYKEAVVEDLTDEQNNNTETVKGKGIEETQSIEVNAEEYTYNGEAKEPGVTVKDAGKTLQQGKDYELRYEDNINAGTAFVSVEGKGDYINSVSEPFTINKAKATASATIKNKLAYRNKLTTEVLTDNVEGEVTYQYWTLNEDGTKKEEIIGEVGESYTVGSGLIGKSIGVTVKVGASQNYEETIIEDITDEQINGSASVNETNLNSITFEGNIISGDTGLVYNGTAQKPNVILKPTGEDYLIEGQDYVVIYEDNVNAGTASILIEGKDNYTGTMEREFRIAQSDSIDTVTIEGDIIEGHILEAMITRGNKNNNAKVSYQWWYSNSINYTSNKVMINSAIGRQKTLEITHELSEATVIGVIVTTANTKNFPSHTYDQIPPKFANLEVTLSQTVYTYDGTPKRPTVTLKSDNIVLTDYTVSYINETNAGTASAILTGKNSLVGLYIAVPYTINKATIAKPTSLPNEQYTGNSITVTAGAGITLTGDVTKKDVGNYYVFANLTDKQNYTWQEDGTSGEIRLSWSIYATVTYQKDGTVSAITKTTEQTTGTVTLPGATAAPGYENPKWYNGSTLVGVPGQANVPITSNVTLTAKATPASQSVHFLTNTTNIIIDGACRDKAGMNLDCSGTGTAGPRSSQTLNLSTSKTYVLSFDYKCSTGTNVFNVDLYPDSLPETHPTATTSWQHYDWEIKSTNSSMSSCTLRFFDNQSSATDTGTITITNVFLREKITYSKTYGTQLGTLPSATRSVHTLNGFYTSSTGGNKISTSTTVPAGGATYYSQWSINPSYCNISLDRQSGTGGTERIYEKYGTGYYLDTALTKQITTSANKITVPTRTGYTFGGYYTSTNGGGTQVINASGLLTAWNTNTTIFTANGTLYAKWTANTITLTLNNQSATSAGTTAAYYKYGTATYYSNSGCTTKITSITKPTKSGYAFEGYYTSTNGGGTQYINASGAFVNNPHTKLSTNTTLYAKWRATNWTITFNGNGGTPSQSTRTVTQGNTLGTLPTATKSSDPRVFTGWYTAASGGSEITASTKPTANTTYYAHWAQAEASYTKSGSTVNVKYTFDKTFTVSSDPGSYSFEKTGFWNDIDARIGLVYNNGSVHAELNNYNSNWRKQWYLFSDYQGRLHLSDERWGSRGNVFNVLGKSWQSNPLTINTELQETCTNKWNGASTSQYYTVYWNGHLSNGNGATGHNQGSNTGIRTSGNAGTLYVRHPYKTVTTGPVWGGEDYGWVYRDDVQYTYQYLQVCDSATITYQMYRTAWNYGGTNTVRIFGYITLNNYNPVAKKKSTTQYDVNLSPSTYYPTHIGIVASGDTYREDDESTQSGPVTITIPITNPVTSKP